MVLQGLGVEEGDEDYEVAIYLLNEDEFVKEKGEKTWGKIQKLIKNIEIEKELYKQLNTGTVMVIFIFFHIFPPFFSLFQFFFSIFHLYLFVLSTLTPHRQNLSASIYNCF
jgi:hypothetical protein